MLGVKQNRCSKCRYSFVSAAVEDNKYLPACIYILKTGKRRPCEAGENCVVFEKRMKEQDYGRDYHFGRQNERVYG